MKTAEWVEKELDEARKRIGFRLEEAALDFTEQIGEQMEKQGVSKADLARSIDKSRAYVTKVLSGEYYKNLTLKTMVGFAMALGSRITIKVEPEVSGKVLEHENHGLRNQPLYAVPITGKTTTIGYPAPGVYAAPIAGVSIIKTEALAQNTSENEWNGYGKAANW